MQTDKQNIEKLRLHINKYQLLPNITYDIFPIAFVNHFISLISLTYHRQV